MAKAKTMFTSDKALESLLAAATPASQKQTEVAPAPRKKTQQRNTPDKQLVRQQLNIELSDDLYCALDLRKMRARRERNDSENSFKKIVEASLRAYLSDELQEGK